MGRQARLRGGKVRTTEGGRGGEESEEKKAGAEYEKAYGESTEDPS